MLDQGFDHLGAYPRVSETILDHDPQRADVFVVASGPSSYLRISDHLTVDLSNEVEYLILLQTRQCSREPVDLFLPRNLLIHDYVGSFFNK